MIVLLMGVSGSGKTTIGRLLAERLGVPFYDADGFHPPANVAKMSNGQPLTDADREPWLDAIATAIREHRDEDRSAVFSCSALKQSYRDRLAKAGPFQLVHLQGDRALLEARLADRKGHFFPKALLDSQLAELDPPGEENAMVVSIDHEPTAIAQQIEARLSNDAGASC